MEAKKLRSRKEVSYMETLIVTYACKPGMREKFLEAIKSEGLDEKSRAEDGNIRYAYALAVEESDRIYLLEQWASQEVFDEHCATEHFKRIGEIKGEYVLDTIIEKY